MFGKELGKREIEYFAGRMATYVKRGHKIQRALDTLSTNSNRRIATAAKTVLGYMVAGAQPDVAFQRSGYFPPEFIAVVKAGMKTPDGGKLYLELANTITYAAKIRSDVIGLMKTPILYIIMILGMSAVMGLMVIPSFLSDPSKAEGTAAIIIATIDFIKGLSIPSAVVIVAIIGGTIYSLLMVDDIRRVAERYLIKTPLIGRLILQMDIARATAYLGLLLETDKSGRTPYELAAKTVTLLILKDALNRWSELAMSISPVEAFEKSSSIWPKDLKDSIEAGVNSGALPDELKEYSTLLREEVSATIDFTKPMVNFASIMFVAIMSSLIFLDCFITPMVDRMSGI